MDETEMQPKGQKPSASSQAGLSKNMIIAISVIIGGVLVIGLGVGLGVGLNNVETISESSETSESQSVTTTSTHPVNQETASSYSTTTPVQEAKTKEMIATETTTSPSTGADAMASSMASYFNTSQCEFNVSDICYWSYLKYTKGINFTEAQQICADKGSVPAYFPTELAYNKTVESLRVKMRADGKIYAGVYTGVMVDGQTVIVTYPNTEVYIKWYPGYPYKNDGTSVFLYITSSYHDIRQGMLNDSPNTGMNGVVCQNNLN